MASPLQQLIDEYLLYLENKEGASGATARNYRFYLTRYVQLTGSRDLADITKENIRNFQYALASQRSQRRELMRPSTINYHLIALRSLCTYARSQGQAAYNPDDITLLKTKQTPREAPNTSDISRLLEAPLLNKKNNLIQKRDKALLELLTSTGLKVSELTGLTKYDIDFKKNTVSAGGRHDKSRRIPFTNQAHYWLRQYLNERNDALPALFVRHDKAKKKQLNQAIDTYRLTPRSIQRLLKKYVKSAGLDPRTSPQSLRNAYATQLLEHGENEADVQHLLGHATKATTARYKKR